MPLMVEGQQAVEQLLGGALRQPSTNLQKFLIRNLLESRIRDGSYWVLRT
jgi:hypothetical protein